VWEKFSDAETAVVQEAGASATIYRLTTGPDPEAVATRAALGNYLRLAIDRDWPLMATGKESREVTQALNALYAAALRLMENGSRQPAIFVEMLKQLDAITQARRTRLHKESREVTQALNALHATALRLMENGSRQPAIFVEMLRQLGAITQARRTRLRLATGIVPGIVWLVLSCGALLTVGFTFFFGTKNLPAQVMMTGILSVVVFMGLL
jgi:hypothetical protein